MKPILCAAAAASVLALVRRQRQFEQAVIERHTEFVGEVERSLGRWCTDTVRNIERFAADVNAVIDKAARR